MLKHVVFLLSLFTLFSCDSAVEPPASSNDYLPLMEGSTWVYKGDFANFQDRTYSFTCVDTLYYGVKVKLLVDRSIQAGYRYYKSGDTTFISWYTLNKDLFTPFLIPKIGATWTTEYENAIFSTQKISSIVQSIDDTLTVTGKKFTDVMNVRLEIITNDRGIIDTAIGTHYFSKGVGLIKSINSPFFNLDIVDFLIR